MLSLDKIYQASFILKKVLHSTELVYAPKLVPGCELYIKPEIFRSPVRSRFAALIIRCLS